AALGLNVQQLIAAGPKEAFLEITEALGKVEDPMTRNALASELFGSKLAKTLLPTLGELRQKLGEVPQSAIISNENVMRAKEFDDALSHAWTTLKAWTVTAAGAGVDALKAIGKAQYEAQVAEMGLTLESEK